ncbi:MAG: CheR family methyltransferase [Daejeonella sp.]
MSKTNKDKTVILSKNLFPVVGIGASAGGLEAFKKLVGAIPENSGMAYILVQHLHPEYDSALPEILQKITKIPVLEISDNVHVEPDHIYVIPSNKMLVASDGILQLSPRLNKERINLPINLFFSSLAAVHQSHSIGVILSGTGKDGTIGFRDIKDNGGITFAQDVASASYDGMPQNAVDADVVDFILSPEKIPAKLIELQKSFQISSLGDDSDPKDNLNEHVFRQILALLKVRVNVDFAYYKQTTVRRRIIRRMVMLSLESISAYLEHLKKDKTELDILFHDLLIPVTSFFRDTHAFETFCETILPDILKDKSNSNPVRIWVTACSTGQEAYSMAICLHEFLSYNISNIKVQIFATDISLKSINKARTGIYSKRELEGISENRLHQFFNKKDGDYQVKKTVRDMCVFAEHNFLKDPPFARMDLISCRNVLIYFQPFLQKKAFNMFHYALKDKGTLWLGKSESTGSSSELFVPFGKKDKFYTRKSISSRLVNLSNERQETALGGDSYAFNRINVKTEDYQKVADDILLCNYTPVGVVVNEQSDIVQFRGLTGEFLEASPGKASLNVLKMAKEGLAFELRNALHKARISKEPVVKEGIPIDKGKKLVTIEVIPLLNIIDLHFLILFKGRPAVSSQQSSSGSFEPADKKADIAKDLRIKQLEKELSRARDDMRSITEEQEAANEELQSANEELLSGSEELQSLNEELETSKEELQSSNEELVTVNQELFETNEQLHQNRKFTETTISSLHESLLVLDKDYCVKSASSSFYKTHDTTEEETLGKNIFELQNNSWDIPELRKGLINIQRNKEKAIELEITPTLPVVGERVISINLRMVNREDTGEYLILMALEDITSKRNEEKLLAEKAEGVLENRRLLHSFLTTAPALCAILSVPDYVFEFANTSYLQFTGHKDLVGKTLKDTMPELEAQGFYKLLDDVYKTGKPFIGKEIPLTLNTGNPKTQHTFLNFSYQLFKNSQGKPEGIFVFAYDVTEQVMARKKIEDSEKRFSNILLHSPMGTAILKGPEMIIEVANPVIMDMWGKGNSVAGKRLLEVLPEIKDQGAEEIYNGVYLGGKPFYGYEMEFSLVVNDLLEICFFNFIYQPYTEVDGTISGVTILATDVTEVVKVKRVIKKAQEEFAEELQKQIDERIKLEVQKNRFISMASHELKTPVTSIKGYTQVLQQKFKKAGNIEAEAFLAKMDKQINKLTSLINDLLDSTKVTQGQLKYNEELFNFNDLADEIVDEMQQTTKSHTIELNLGDTKMILGDRNRIGQVIINMLSNAIKYSPRANQIMVSTSIEKSNLKFNVQDFGIGISKESQLSVFDQFFRVNGILQDTFAGLGLGLFIASEIVKRHNGLMSVKSIEGKGSTFSFTLPFGKQLH